MKRVGCMKMVSFCGKPPFSQEEICKENRKIRMEKARPLWWIDKKKNGSVPSFYLSDEKWLKDHYGLFEGVSIMGSLKRCPECHTKFQADEKDMQVCKVCGYWTKKGTVRIESIMLYA